MPKVYLYATHASTFWLYLQNPARFGVVQRTALPVWLQYKWIAHIVQRLPMM